MTGCEVWITGIGAVTAAGAGTGALEGALIAGRSELGLAPELGALVGRVPALPSDGASRRLDRSGALFLAAATEAWRDAGLSPDTVASDRCGVIEGSSLGPLADVLDTVRAEPSGRDHHATGLLRFMIGAGGTAFAQRQGIRGPVTHVSAASVSSSFAIGQAYALIAGGALDVAVAGGAECPLQADVFESFRVGGVLAVGDDLACRPFDPRRRGTVLGEGAGVVVLESAARAGLRGARPRAVIAGFGQSRETYSLIRPDPRGHGVAQAVRAALNGVDEGEIGWIKSHGTGTRLNDAAECAGLATVFGPRLPDVPLTSLKPTVGHCLGASGAVETVAAVLALGNGMVPATLGTECADRDLPSCRVVVTPEASDARRVLLLAESFGGRCAALLVGAA